MKIYVWPDGTWCEPEDLEEMLAFMSDDFSVEYINENDERIK